MAVRALDLVLHDWRNLTTEERATALDDIRGLATTFGAASPQGAGRRARALNIVASYFHYLEEVAAEPPAVPSPRCKCGSVLPGALRLLEPAFATAWHFKGWRCRTCGELFV